MGNAGEPAWENETLRQLLSHLSEASLQSRLPAMMDLRKPSSQGSILCSLHRWLGSGSSSM